MFGDQWDLERKTIQRWTSELVDSLELVSEEFFKHLLLEDLITHSEAQVFGSQLLRPQRVTYCLDFIARKDLGFRALVDFLRSHDRNRLADKLVAEMNSLNGGPTAHPNNVVTSEPIRNSDTDFSTFHNEYEVKEELGNGAFGVVYSVCNRQPDLSQQVYAIKVTVIPKGEDKLNEMMREVSGLGQCRHEGIIGYHRCWREERIGNLSEWEKSFWKSLEQHSPRSIDTRPYLFIQMEKCDKTLLAWLMEHTSTGRTKQQIREGLGWFDQILAAVGFIHSQSARKKKMIHRDLKPANIFFSHNGIIKVGDLGLVHIRQRDESASTESKSRNRGTGIYQSPEMCQGRKYDHMTDIYSLGVILLQLLETFSEHSQLLNRLEEITRNEYKSETPEIKLVYTMLRYEPNRRLGPTSTSTKGACDQIRRCVLFDRIEPIDPIWRERFVKLRQSHHHSSESSTDDLK